MTTPPAPLLAPPLPLAELYSSRIILGPGTPHAYTLVLRRGRAGQSVSETPFATMREAEARVRELAPPLLPDPKALFRRSPA